MAADDNNLRVGQTGVAAQQAASRRFSTPPTPTKPAPVASTTMYSYPNASGRYQTSSVAPSGPPGQAPGQVPAIGVDDYLGQDIGYQQQLREFANALAQLSGDITTRRGQLNSQYDESKHAMEDQKVKDLQLMQDDYGARGILRSGLYGKAVGDYNTEFGNRANDLSRNQADALSGLDSELGRFKSSQQLQQESAKEAAIRRRAEKYGI